MCDIRYFKSAYHKLICAKELIKNYSWDEMFLNDTAYNLQQSVEFTLKAFLECKGVTVHETHQLSKLLYMTKDNGSACILTPWIEEHAYLLTEWESQTRYKFDYFLEMETVKSAISEIENFLTLNGLSPVREEKITDDVEKKLRMLLPANIKDLDDFSLNVFYHVFEKKLKS